MAEAGGSSVNYTYLRTRRGGRRARKPQSETGDMDGIQAPKVIIKKRPPRRPKLPNGEVVQPPASSYVVESCETVVQSMSYEAGGVLQYTEEVHMEQVIEETRGQMSGLHLSQESLRTESVQSTPKRRVRRPRKRNKNKGDGEVDQENDESNSNEEPQPSVSTYFNDEEEVVKKKEKEKLPKNFTRRHMSKGDKRNALDENNSQDNNDRGNGSGGKINGKDKKKKEKRAFIEHLPVEVVRKILEAQDPQNPNIIEGFIRINPRCYQNAYVSLVGEQDILIIGLRDRNRALEGDLVAVTINPKSKWFKVTQNTFQKTGTVVSILEKAHPRKAVGFLKKQDVFVFLQPRDSRVPLMKINPKTVPRNFYDNPELFKETLFLCNIIDWKKVAFAEGEIEQIVGNKGDLAVETNAILLENDLILTPYEDELLKDLPPPDYIPTESDISGREDLRSTCIFTIDPATAVDLDDALSCRPLENGNFELGVHIADVTHFLEAFSPLDHTVAKRATTVYLVDNVYHMLPKQLCLACSLLPGQDKLAFSVILEMTPDAEVVNYRFAKTVINSCCQMSYDQAQIMIDDESYDWSKDESLKIAGNYKPSDLVKVVKNLYDLSLHLKNRRFDEGALRIDQPKLCVLLDKVTRLPISYRLDERKESNSLIEEFMLLANMTVAKHLYETLPDVALLRSHAEPAMRILKKIRDLLTKFGVVLDVDSAGSLNNSLLSYQPNSTEDPNERTDLAAQYRMMVINSLCAKSMTRALYRCSSSVKSRESLRHYALNAEFYTHFTSPIRRYPDCVVHRLLHASMTNQPMPPEWSSELCEKVAANCNTKKYSAKMAQEQSNALYFTYMLDLRGSMNALAVVMDVKERSADAMLCDTGLKVRLYFSDTIEETACEFSLEEDVPTVKINWIEREIVQVINIFSILHVKITKHPQLFRLQGILLPPINLEENDKL